MLEVEITEVKITEVEVEIGRDEDGASLWLLHQQLADEVLGHLGGLAEAALLKLVGTSHNVGECLSIRLTLEGGRATEPVGTQQSY